MDFSFLSQPAFSGGGTDLLQQIQDGTDKADVIINLRTVREALRSARAWRAASPGGALAMEQLP